MLFKNAFVFTGDAFEALDVAAENGVITAVGALDGPGEDCTGRYLLPGLVDLHTHGCGGRDFDTAGPDQMREMEKTYARHGTAAVLLLYLIPFFGPPRTRSADPDTGFRSSGSQSPASRSTQSTIPR